MRKRKFFRTLTPLLEHHANGRSTKTHELPREEKDFVSDSSYKGRKSVMTSATTRTQTWGTQTLPGGQTSADWDWFGNVLLLHIFSHLLLFNEYFFL